MTVIPLRKPEPADEAVAPVRELDAAPAPQPVDRFPCLDGYRAFAALAVLVYHVLGELGLHRLEPLGAFTSRLGNYGVALFFLLSGFLLYGPYAAADLAGGRAPNARRFLTRRLLRIVPAYWVVLTALFFILRTKPVAGWGDLATFYGFAQIYRPGMLLSGLGVAWTLCVEMAFYASLPLLALGARAIGRRRWTQPAQRVRAQLLALAALYATGVLWRVGVLTFAPSDRRFLSMLPAFFDWFALGMALALAAAWIERGGRAPWALEWLGRHSWASLLIAVELFWITAQLHLPRDFTPATDWQTMGRFLLNGLSAFFLLLPGIVGRQDQGRLRRLLRSDWAQELGKISYGIYLWHTIWLALIVHHLLDGDANPGLVPVLTLTVALTLTSSWLSLRFVERPAMALSGRSLR